jgi:hypothetical protein
MVDTTTQVQVIREAPDLEAEKLGLIDSAKALVEKGVNLPTQQVAELTDQQKNAIAMAGKGIGTYEPYIKNAGEAFTKSAEGYAGLPGYGIAGINTANAAGKNAVAETTGYGDLATLLATSGAQNYDPNSVATYMNPYQQNVTQNAIAEMNRQAEIQRANNSAAAAKAGAFGGSRFGVQTAETNRNLADVQAKKIFEDYYNNYAQAQKSSMDAWNSQQTRAQNAGTTALGAGKAIGDVNLAAGTLGLNATTNAGNLQTASAQGIESLGKDTADLGQKLSSLQQGDTSFLYNVGQKQQDQKQKELDTGYKNELAAAYQPFQLTSWASDIYKGIPSSQQTLASTTTPSPSLVSQVAGGATTALAAANLLKP